MIRLRGIGFCASVFLLAAALAPGCADEEESKEPTEVAEPGEPGEEPGEPGEPGEEMVSRPLTSSDLAPVIQETGAAGVVPSKIVIEFARPVIEQKHVNRKIPKETVLKISPEVRGQWKFTSTSTLTFTPRKPFKPSTTYKVTLNAVKTKTGVIKAPVPSPWLRRFTTPKFDFVRASLAKLDYRRKRVHIDLVFSAPVDRNQVRRNAEFTILGPGGKKTKVSKVGFERGRDKHIARAVFTHSDVRAGRKIRLALAAGLPMAGAPKTKAGAATDLLSLEEGEPIDIRKVYRTEGATGFYLEVICDDGAVDDKRYYWDRVGHNSYYGLSRRCQLTDDDGLEGIHIEPQVKHSIAPSGGGFRIFGDFKRGTYTVRIDAGVRSVDGGVLHSDYEKTFSVSARTPQVSFTSQGRYLPRKAWNTLAIRHLNVDQVTLTARHVPPENLVFWMSDPETEAASVRNSNLVLKQKIPLKGRPDTMTTSHVSVASKIPASTKGLLEVMLTSGNASAKARVLLTDIHLVAKMAHPQEGKPWGQEVYAWALDMDTVQGLSGVEMKVVRQSGQAMAGCTTDGSGGCRMALPEKDVDPSPPFAVIAEKGDDMTYLKFADLRAEVQDARISGEPYRSKRKYRASIYSDRGVYRPGETAHIVGIVRDQKNQAPKPGMPVQFKLTDPRGKTIKSGTLKVNNAGIVTRDVSFAAFATTGAYSVQLRAAKRHIGGYSFQVEEFVPERMKVKAKAGKPGYLRGDEVSIDVEAKYLFGGVPADHRVELSCELAPGKFSPKENVNFQYGTWSRSGAPSRTLMLGSVDGGTDQNGLATLTCPGGEGTAAGFDGPAKLIARAAVFEAGSGRTTVGRTTVAVHPEKFYIGLSSGTKQVEANTDMKVEGVVVDWDGKLTKQVKEVELAIYRLESDYGWYWDEEMGEETYRRHQRPVLEDKSTLKVNNGKFKTTWKPKRDAEGFLVRAKAGDARSELELEGKGGWYWWWGPDEARADLTPRPDKPTWIALKAPKQIEVGEAATVKFKAPYKGRALFTVETDHVLINEWQDIAKAGDASWSFTLEEFAPNVYITAFVAKDPHLDSKEAFLPDRAFGVESATVVPAAFTHPLKMDTPKEIRSSSRLTVKLDLGRVEGKTYATVAAVDEGILQLTQFKSPDPFKQIFTRRALGVDTFETVGWTLLVPPGSPSGTTGGGEDEEDGGQLGRVQPVKPVALWSGVREVPSNGKLEVTFEVPRFRGQLRVMAVTCGKKRMGKASADVVVRDPLVVQATLPRFLTQGDEIQIPVFVTNLSGKKRDVNVELTAENLPVPGLKEPPGAPSPLAVSGQPQQKLTLENEKGGVVVFKGVTKRSIGAAKVTVTVSSGKLKSVEDADVPLLPASPKSRSVQTIELAEGNIDLKPYLQGWVPMSERSTFWVTSNPYGEAFDHLKYLLRYPYGCIEQTTSTARPLLFVGNLLHNVDPTLVAGDKIEDMVMHGVDRILSMQTPSGGFAYWPGGTEPCHWGTAYATHMLIDAKKQRFPVSQALIDDAVQWMEEEITNRFESDYYGRHRSYVTRAEPYFHYVLALSGKARKARIHKLIKRIGDNPKNDEQEHLYMLKAALYLAGDHRYEGDLKNPDVSPITSYRRNSWSFYSDRRRRGFLLSTFADLFPGDKSGDKLANLVAEGLKAHRSSWYTTQELVWGISGLGKTVQAGARDFDPPKLFANGKSIAAEKPPAGQKVNDRTFSLARASEYDKLELKLGKKSQGKLYLILSSDGVRTEPDYKIGGDGLAISREYLDIDGSPIELVGGSHALGDMVYVSISLTNRTGERVSNIALVDRLPAGWEIENPRLGRAGGGSVEWLDRDDVWQADHMDLRDDRVEVFGHLDRGQTRMVVFAARAVTAGTFTIPSIEAEAMYDPRIWARQDGEKVEIAGPWDEETH